MKLQWTWGVVTAAIGACGDAGAPAPLGTDAGSCAIVAGTYAITGGGTAVSCPSPGTLERFDGTLTLGSDPSAPGRFTLATSGTLNALDLDPTPVVVSGCALRVSVSRGVAPRITATVYDLVFRGAGFSGAVSATISDGAGGAGCTITTPVSGARR